MTTREWNPGLLLSTSSSYWEGCALHAGVKLGLFTVLGEDRLSGEEIAGRLSGDPRGVLMLLNALTAMGLLARSEDGYENTPFSRAFLAKGSRQYLGHIILHHHNLMPFWARLDGSVLSGLPARPADSSADEHALENFLMGMFNIAMATAPAISDEVDLAGRARLLDLGGGPGTHAIHFCKRNPDLRATIFDLPLSRPFAEKTIERFGLSDRIRFVGGDYLKDPLGGPYDVVWMSQILHQQSPEECRRIISSAVSSLSPGGTILVHEFLLDDTMDGPLFPALFSLNMLINTAAGQSYSDGQLREMLAQAGVKDIARLPYRGPTDSGIIAGVV